MAIPLQLMEQFSPSLAGENQDAGNHLLFGQCDGVMDPLSQTSAGNRKGLPLKRFKLHAEKATKSACY